MAETKRIALRKRLMLKEPVETGEPSKRFKEIEMERATETETRSIQKDLIHVRLDESVAPETWESEDEDFDKSIGQEVLSESETNTSKRTLEQVSLQFGSLPQKTPVNMVSVLPLDFMAKEEQSKTLEGDVDDTTKPMLLLGEECILEIESKDKVVFEKPEGRVAKHLKPLYIKIHLDGKPVSRVLVDNGAAINIITTTMLRRLGKKDCVLKPAPMTIMNFMGKAEKSKGILVAEVTVGEKTKTT